MKRALPRLAAGVLVWAVCSGCGGPGRVDVEAANATATPGVAYSDTATLLQALNAGGLACDPAGAEPRGTGSVEACSLDTGDVVTAWVFPDGAATAAFSSEFITSIEQYGGRDLLLQGLNWVLTADELDAQGEISGFGHEDLLAAQGIIGGLLVPIDAG
jgi:hypothetical protein